jgi:hypothetical protein
MMTAMDGMSRLCRKFLIPAIGYGTIRRASPPVDPLFLKIVRQRLRTGLLQGAAAFSAAS